MFRCHEQDPTSEANEDLWYDRKITLRELPVPPDTFPRGVRVYLRDSFTALQTGGTVQRDVEYVDGGIKQIVLVRLHGRRAVIQQAQERVIEHGRQMRLWSYEVHPDELLVPDFVCLEDEEGYEEYNEHDDEEEEETADADGSSLSSRPSQASNRRLSQAVISSHTGSDKQQVFENEKASRNYLSSAAHFNLEEAEKAVDEAQEEVDEAEKKVDKAEKQVHDAKKEVKEGKKKVREAEAKVDEAQQQVDEAKEKVRKLGQALCIVAEEDRAALEREKRLADHVLKDCEDNLVDKEAYVVKSKEFLAEKQKLLAEEEAILDKKKASLTEKRSLLDGKEAFLVLQKASVADKATNQQKDRGSSSASSFPHQNVPSKKEKPGIFSRLFPKYSKVFL